MDQARLGVPLVAEPGDAAGDSFYASDLLAKVAKDKFDSPRPGEQNSQVDDSAFSKDAEFYAADALAKAEKQENVRK